MAEIHHITYEGKDVTVKRDSYGDWILVQNYEHYGGENPSVSPGSTFPQLPNGLTSPSDVNNLGTSGELRHVDNITQYGTFDVDAVQLFGETENHTRTIHYYTTDQTVIDSIVDNSVDAGYADLQNATTKFSDHDANLPDGATAETYSNSNRIFGWEFPMYDGGNWHWALAGNGDRWEVDDFPGNASQTTVHRVWVRIVGGFVLHAPSNVSCTVNSDDSIDVSWNDNSSNEDNFRVEIDRDSSGWSDPSGGPSTPGSNSTSANYNPNSDTAYDRQVGIDSTFKFRVRAENSNNSTSWASSGTVATTPIPPHNPRVTRPDGNSVKLIVDVQSDLADHMRVDIREDTGSGYGSWTHYDWLDPGETDSGDPGVTGDTVEKTYTVGTTYEGNTAMQENARYQFRVATHVNDYSVSDSEWIYADYGNRNNVFFEDDFESGDLSKWDSTQLSDGQSGVRSDGHGDLGINGADEGTYWLRIDGGSGGTGDYVQKNLGDLSNESNVIVKLAMATGSMDNSNESTAIEWYDGSAWQQLREHYWEYNKQGWVEVFTIVPDSWLSTDNRLRLWGLGNLYGGDHSGFDRVVVSDLLHEYTTPAAPSSLSLTAGEGTVDASWTTNAVNWDRNYNRSWIEWGDTGPIEDRKNHYNLGSSRSFTNLQLNAKYTVIAETITRQPRNGTGASSYFHSNHTSATTTTTGTSDAEWDVDDWNRNLDESGTTHDLAGDDRYDHLVQGYDHGSLTRGLVGYWKLDEGTGSTAGDSTELTNDGSITGATWISGYLGDYALSFDGTDDYVEIPSLPLYPSFTAALWARSPTSSWNTTELFSCRFPNGFIIHADGSNSRMDGYIEDADANHNKIGTSSSLDITQWHHYGVSYNSKSNAGILWVDGSKSVVSDMSIERNADSNTARLARGAGGVTSRYLECDIDGVRVFNRSLSKPEMEAIASLTRPSTISPGDSL